MIIHLVIDGEIVQTTPEHPFYIADGEWINAADLQVGDQIRNLEGEHGTVERVTVITQTETMYNLTVDEAHTFFVGDGAWLVHNCADILLEAIDDLVRVRHYSKKIEQIQDLMEIRAYLENGPYIWVEAPIVTANTVEAIQITTAKFYRPLNQAGGFVEFSVKSVWLRQDPNLSYLSNSKVIDLIHPDLAQSILDAFSKGKNYISFNLDGDFQNAIFFDWKGVRRE
jgi:hypothetical protein